jgi:hypothetical protein
MSEIQIYTLRQFFGLWNADPTQGVKHLLDKINMKSLRTALQDADFDGIPEGIEGLLLEKFRPLFRFSSNNGAEEHFLPTSYMDFINRSGMILRSDGGDQIKVNPGGFSADPLSILKVDESNGSSPTQLNSTPDRTNYRLFVDQSFYPGFDDGRMVDEHWADIANQKNVGLYGHVTRDQFGNFKIEYWQFYAYNNADQDNNTYDHEADQEAISILVDANTLNCVSASYFPHGYEIRFDLGTIEPEIQGDIAEYHGKNYYTGYIDIHVDGPAGIGWAQNNLLRMHAETLPGGAFGEFSHPVVYIEYGTHATWPSEHWDYIGAPDHGGDGVQFLTNLPPNLGEVEHPLSVEATIITQFNGYWGKYAGPGIGPAFPNDNSPGPGLHKTWQWPAGSALKGAINPGAFE